MRRSFALLAALAAIAGCNNVPDDLDADEEKPKEVPQKALDIKSVVFSPDAKTMTLSALAVKDLGDIPLENPDSVSLSVKETDEFGKAIAAQPEVFSVIRTGADEITKAGLHMSIMVDLTLSNRLIEAQKSAVRQIRSVFGEDNLALTFLTGDGLTKSSSVADFVLENDFVRDDDGGNKKLLLKAILTNLTVARDSAATQAGRKDIVLAFSNGKVYNGSRTIDPQHFSRQEELTKLCSTLAPTTAFYYVNFAPQNAPGEAEYFLKSLCESTQGFYQDSFSWNKIADYLFPYYNINYTDFKIVLTNPDGKLYNGHRQLSLEFTYKDEMVADAQADYTLGTFHQPVIVNGIPHAQVILQGVLITALLLLLVFIVFQYITPRISYLLFRKKYVREYTGGNMSIGGVLVGDECYYCKAPFVQGEKIVAKCKHVMHLQCWEENGHHCPEFGRNCKEGSHYYNRSKPSDPKNASYILKWIFAGVVAGFLSWLLFSSLSNQVSVNWLMALMMKIYGIKAGSPEATIFTVKFFDHLNQLPSFGLGMGFFLTLFLSILTIHKRNFKRMAGEIFLRAIGGAVTGYILFMGGCILSQIADMKENNFLIDWIPWALTGFAIALISTIGTNMHVRRKWILVSIALGVVSMFLWNMIFVKMGTDYRTLLLLSHAIFSVGLALSVAQDFPRSERYFLHAGGSLKEMDIAIYKWFEANTNRVVTLGKSVDCDLVMSWDVKGDIAPVQANLSKEGDRVYITPLEPGIFHKDKPLPTGKKEQLFHGKKIVIGTTELTYLEKDV
ncbi:MAG: hypothetical protein J6Y32_06915 [Bacteroidales bacterium]|nr:hypothetical protein [Bacteroidales bacterium]